MNKEEFDRALKEKDFCIGDTFWLDDVEFEVKNKRYIGVDFAYG